MAAGRRKKRLISASGGGYTHEVQSNLKRKKVVSPIYDLDLRPNIILEWDDKGKSVVAKKEQVSIAWSVLSPFLDAVPTYHNTLADVVNIPQETFEIENLTEVLSCEVWQTHLSEEERELLAQFLPKGFDAQQIVQDLLEGDNFHFGNPYLKWGASLCSGYLHPDMVLKKECSLMASKKAYYSELQNYHHDMIRDLQVLKENWSQKDPENHIEHNGWRSGKHAEQTLAAHANKSALHDLDDNLTSESCSATDDKACSSDEMNFRSLHENSQRSICRKDSVENTYDNAADGVKVVPRRRMGEKLQNGNHQSGDGAKYMSYIKVSKEQHQCVKNSMKHNSNSIQSRSLNHVLGDLGTFYVQPYILFEEEERQKLHVHWSRLAKVDIAAAHTNLRNRQIKKQQVMHSLGRDMVAKLNYIKENEEKRTASNLSSDQVDDEDSDPEPSTSAEGEGSEISNSLLEEDIDNVATNHESSILLEETQDGEHRNLAFINQQHTDIAAANNEPSMDDETLYVSTLAQNYNLQQDTLLGGNHVFHSMDLILDENPIMPKRDDLLPSVSKFTESLRQLIPCSQESPLFVACDVWPAVSMSNAYYNSTNVSYDYASANELSNGQSKNMEEHPTQLINLKSDMHEVDLGNDLPSRQANDIFFSSYPNQVQDQQFQSFLKGPGSGQYHNEQKPRTLDFQPQANMMIENSQQVGNFTEQLHPSMALDLGRKRLIEPFMHESIHDNMYLNGLGHALPSPDHFLSSLASSTFNMQSWGANNVHPGLSQSHPNGGELLSQNWVSVDNNDCGGWSGLEATFCQNQNFGNVSIADQSLFSVLSQCNNSNPSDGLHSSLSYQERFNRSVDHIGGIVPATSNLIPGVVNQHVYLNGHENTNGLKANNTGWTSLPHQNTALHDSLGKPYLRYWNQ